MRRLLLSSLSAIALLAACGPTEDLTTVPAATYDEATTAQLTSNPLLAEWTGEHGGQPAFDKLDLAQLKPAMEAGMAAHLAEIDAIANNPAKASFENTIVLIVKIIMSIMIVVMSMMMIVIAIMMIITIMIMSKGVGEMGGALLSNRKARDVPDYQ